MFFLIVGFFIKRGIKDVPGKFQNFFEAVLEFLLSYVDRVTGDRKKSLKFMPIVGSLFLFILVSNWIGIFPGIGSIGITRISSAGTEFIPLFRSANSDLNLTLAMALVGVALSHIIGVGTAGFYKYSNKFIKLGDLYAAIKTMKPIVIFTAFAEFGAGLIEVVSEIGKIFSLSLRLFGNVFAGEILLTVLAGLFAYILPLPFIFLELLVGFIQAVVFSMLVLVYFTIATMPLHQSSHGSGSHPELEAHAS